MEIVMLVPDRPESVPTHELVKLDTDWRENEYASHISRTEGVSHKS
jgi:hypothetical protein